MKYMEYIEKLKQLSSEKYRANIIKLGIPEKDCIGVSVADIRRLAKGEKKDNKLAFELWQTGYHEAKLLAILFFDNRTIDFMEVERLLDDVFSWDLCDFLCNNLIIKMKEANEFISYWIAAEHLYRKRAAFSIIAMNAMHKRNITDEEIEGYLHDILLYSDDDRNHVKKAVSWALREIGKINYDYNEKAIIVAYELMEQGTKSQKWVGKDALRELENLVKVDERQRLLSRESKMGKQVL